MSEAHSIATLPEESFRWYFTGMSDGEGSFVIYANKNKQTRSSWRLAFSIGMRLDEEANLRALASRVGVGRIYRLSRRNPGGNRNPAISWLVNRPDELATVILPHFERYPLQFKKARDFAIWRQAVPLVVELAARWRASRGHRLVSDGERAFLDDLATQLKQARLFRHPDGCVPVGG